MKYKRGRYMMGTKAIHKMGDISRDKPNLCIVFEETEEDYIGNWVCGFGFIEVKFPKETTRELTEDEINKYVGTCLAINSNPPHYQFKREDFERDKEELSDGESE